MTMFIHGMGQGPESWNELRKQLKEESLALDLYQLSIDDSLTYHSLYRGLTQRLNEFSSIDRLVGLSLGAVLALNFALDHPGKIEELVLIAGQYKIPKLVMNIQSYLLRWMPGNPLEELGIKKADAISLMQSMSSLDFSRKLADYSGFVKVIVGQKDRANLKASKEMADLFPNAHLYLLEGGHELNVDAVASLAQLLKK